jgi:hypothetical protein
MARSSVEESDLDQRESTENNLEDARTASLEGCIDV